MLLAHRGHEVTIYERNPYIGGRNSALKAGEYTFELGPTFVMLPNVFDELFALTGRKRSNYLEWKRLDTMYRLNFSSVGDFTVHFDKEKFKEEIKRVFPGDEIGYERFMQKTKKEI